MAEPTEGSPIKLLEVHLIETESSKFYYTLSTHRLGECPTYSVLSLLPGSESIFEGFGDALRLAEDVEDALYHAALHTGSKFFWIETFCIDLNDDIPLRQEAQLIKPIHFKTEQVVIWAGNTTTSDFMDPYLGQNSDAFVEEAFEFAQLLATVDVEDIISTIQETRLKGDILSWYHLQRILYRPWFREANLIRSTYINDLPQVAILCGIASTSWPLFNLAAKRLRAAKPAPTFLLTPLLDLQGEIATDKTKLMVAGSQWFDAQIRFGSHSPHHLLGRVMWYSSNFSSAAMENQFLALLGYIADKYHADEAPYPIKEFMEAVGENGEETILLEELEILSEPPSLPFDGKIEPFLDPRDRVPFVHEIVNRSTTVTLMKLLPHFGIPSSTIQCEIFHARRGSIPKFAFVLNAALRPSSPKTNTTILANGQSFVVPKIVELFLRAIREEKEGKVLFVWQLCMFESQVKIKDRKDLENYVMAKAFMKQNGAKALDLYNVLDEAVGLEKEVPEGMGLEEWLLELNC